jgi:hypothetical protein
MANKKGLFGILSDGAGAGVGITLANPDTTLGSAIAATVASPAFINSSGVLVFPQLTPDGAIVVSTEDTGICHYAVSKVTGSTSFQDVAVFTGALSEVYRNMSFVVASMTECDWELVYIDDAAGTPVETILAYFDTGPGQYSFCCELPCVEVDTTTGTGVQEITIRGKLLEATGSEISATLNLHERSN